MANMGANLLGTQANQFARAGTINAATTLLGGLSKWDWKTNQQTSTPTLTERQKRLGV